MLDYKSNLKSKTRKKQLQCTKFKLSTNKENKETYIPSLGSLPPKEQQTTQARQPSQFIPYTTHQVKFFS